MRLSDLHLRYTGKAPRTWLDKYESKVLSFHQKEALFAEKERQIRKKSVERGRKKVPPLIRKCLCPEFKTLKYDPYDIKPLMHPVDFVVFDGLNEGAGVKNVTLLSRKTSDQDLKKILGSIMRTIHKNSYDWKVARISMDGKVNIE